MEVVIQEERSFTFQQSVPNFSFVYPDETSSTAHSRHIRIDQVRVAQELLDGLICAGLTPKVKVGQSIPGLQVWVCFKETAGPAPYEGSILVTTDTNMLSRIIEGKSGRLGEIKLQLEVSKIVGRVRGRVTSNPQFEITLAGNSITPNPGERISNRLEIAATTGANWFAHWSDRSPYNFRWTILLSAKLVLPRMVGADPAIQDLLSATRKLLTDDTLADTKVIAQNGAEINFHRCLLAAHSPAFERMFQTQMKEATCGVLELPDMTEESVSALKEYLYVWELKVPRENSLVCVELFEAGHKYGISTLEEATSKILLRMGGSWYTALVGLRLFLLVKDMELPRLKQKAVKILQLKRAELKTLDEYRDLFKDENAAVTMELTECLASP